jgi:tryptophan-rich sensory protein
MKELVKSDLVRSALGLAILLALCFGAGLAGSQFAPGAWYGLLKKPAWTPPAWVFAPVWTLLYALMAVAAWKVWRVCGVAGAGGALALFVVQLGLNVLWSYLFFGLHRPGWAFAEIVVLFLAILATAVVFEQKVPPAGLLLLPYLGWVGFAAALNLALWRMNLG